MTLPELARQTAKYFADVYGREPRWIAAAPGRVNLIGEHTDYNGGLVLPMAIERYTVVAAAPSATGKNVVQIRTTSGAWPVLIDLTQPVKPGVLDWGNYPRGVVAGFLARGLKFGGFDALINSTVPLGSGLSSSAALEVATATLLEIISGNKLDPVEKALLCQNAEHEFAGMPCGIMDQFISVMGRENHLLLLDCRSHKTELVPMSDPSVVVLIANTNVKHELTGGEYPARRKQCETAAKILGMPSLRDATADALEDAQDRMERVVYRRARHVISEIVRTLHVVEGIRTGNWPTVGQLMYASHYSLKDDYQVSCDELDFVVKIAEAIGVKGGVYGCRMSGGGFGGCAVALVKTEAVEAVSKRIAADYRNRTGIEATIFVTRPAAGTMVIKA